MEKKLPKGWVETTLGDIANWSSGGTPSRANPQFYGGNIPWIKTGDLNDSYIVEASEFITDDGLKHSSAKLFPKGAVAIAMYGATIGKTGIFDIEAATNQACGVGIPIKCGSKFLFYFLKSQKQTFIDLGKGGAQPNISQSVIKSFKINLPPPTEQERIVAKLDTLFAHLETVKAGLEKIPVLLKQFRQAVLTQAVTGKEMLLKSVINSIDQGWSPKCEEFPRLNENSWAVIKTTAVQELVFNQNENKQLPEKLSPKEKYEIKTGDVLITRAGPRIRVGITCVVKEVNNHLMICDKVYRLKVNNSIITPEYLNICLNSNITKQKIEELKTGISESGLNLTQSKFINLNINVPSISEQNEIVRRVEALFAKADAIEEKYKQLKEKIENLPQAILAKAFRGEV